jgi:hypothetical protein
VVNRAKDNGYSIKEEVIDKFYNDCPIAITAATATIVITITNKIGTNREKEFFCEYFMR